MRKGILLFLIIAIICGCKGKRDFVMDPTLQRQYLNDSTFYVIPDNWTGEVKTAEEAFGIAIPVLEEGFGKEDVNHQKPFIINLIDDIWVIEGTLHQSDSEIIYGGTAYIEIKKSNGAILKIVHSE